MLIESTTYFTDIIVYFVVMVLRSCPFPTRLFALLKVLTLLASPLLLNASLVVMVLTGLCNTPLAKLQHKFLTKLLVAQDERFKAGSEALLNIYESVEVICMGNPF